MRTGCRHEGADECVTGHNRRQPPGEGGQVGWHETVHVVVEECSVQVEEDGGEHVSSPVVHELPLRGLRLHEQPVRCGAIGTGREILPPRKSLCQALRQGKMLLGGSLEGQEVGHMPLHGQAHAHDLVAGQRRRSTSRTSPSCRTWGSWPRIQGKACSRSSGRSGRRSGWRPWLRSCVCRFRPGLRRRCCGRRRAGYCRPARRCP